MALEIRGRIIKITDIQSGVSRNGSWAKREFIIETEEQYPKKVCISVWGDKAETFDAQFPVGSLIVASISLESREYNGKWYTDARAWKVEMQSAQIGSGSASVPSPPMPDLADSPAYTSFTDEGADENMPF